MTDTNLIQHLIGKEQQALQYVKHMNMMLMEAMLLLGHHGTGKEIQVSPALLEWWEKHKMLASQLATQANNQQSGPSVLEGKTNDNLLVSDNGDAIGSGVGGGNEVDQPEPVNSESSVLLRA